MGWDAALAEICHPSKRLVILNRHNSRKDWNGDPCFWFNVNSYKLQVEADIGTHLELDRRYTKS